MVVDQMRNYLFDTDIIRVFLLYGWENAVPIEMVSVNLYFFNIAFKFAVTLDLDVITSSQTLTCKF